jgi:hypothetical protein
MIDLVYILGSGSAHRNKELLYSLRSVQRYVKDYRNIYVIGDHPGFEGPFIHIHYPDNGRNKQDNIRQKLTVACQHPDISDPFVMMNDDFFFLEEIELRYIPFYYYSNLAVVHQARRKPGHYKRALNNTVMALGAKGYDIKNYDIHYPIYYDKHFFLETMAQYDWKERDGFVIKSLYCNTLPLMCILELQDCNINNDPQSREQIEQAIEGKFMFSVGDIGMNQTMLDFLADRYPETVHSEISENIEN